MLFQILTDGSKAEISTLNVRAERARVYMCLHSHTCMGVCAIARQSVKTFVLFPDGGRHDLCYL